MFCRIYDKWPGFVLGLIMLWYRVNDNVHGYCFFYSLFFFLSDNNMFLVHGKNIFCFDVNEMTHIFLKFVILFKSSFIKSISSTVLVNH